MTEGWRCPGCGACYAPMVMACWHCRPLNGIGSGGAERLAALRERLAFAAQCGCDHAPRGNYVCTQCLGALLAPDPQ